MSLVVGKESFFWHKLHSLTGVVPVGYYLVQHLTLNTFSIAGPDKFNSIIAFFHSIPDHLLIPLEAIIWGSFIFHAVYGLFIVGRAQPNYYTTTYKWSQNRMYLLQRWSGVFLFFFIIYHVITTSIAARVQGDQVVQYAAWATKLQSYGYVLTLVYVLGITAASYHFSYGLWNFCIRWGITISEKAQHRVQKFSLWCFVVIMVMGLAALSGFFMHTPYASLNHPTVVEQTSPA